MSSLNIGEISSLDRKREQATSTSHAIEIEVNGQPHKLEVEAREILLDTLRERLGFTGVKKSCDHGQCGACTVLLNGRRVNACLLLSVMADGDEVTTIEGLASENGDLHLVQQAFLIHDAFQCGYCTSGQIISTVGMLGEPWSNDSASLRESMSGNLCRCGAYRNIHTAVEEAKSSHQQREASTEEDFS
ncbi:2Fe-2S iron-sulfur cluster-binding protein [Pelagicoccus sp. SDUM812002]|uniref:(2Fe-2S)-binding protein n=1 Tax=Pelagicoccus sp. SDUM812002 TaxID=3041266 RepID=UPI00280E03E8|nr:2Fe-2S iron-sulfur cluster-binding protein [Pelagicoccus sp. SDUM812002]MDQ8188425.1 (2Fe-2S)-binding protein [Pelagicoccus sp. SDUM812002]